MAKHLRSYNNLCGNFLLSTNYSTLSLFLFYYTSEVGIQSQIHRLARALESCSSWQVVQVAHLHKILMIFCGSGCWHVWEQLNFGSYSYILWNLYICGGPHPIWSANQKTPTATKSLLGVGTCLSLCPSKVVVNS